LHQNSKQDKYTAKKKKYKNATEGVKKQGPANKTQRIKLYPEKRKLFKSRGEKRQNRLRLSFLAVKIYFFWKKKIKDIILFLSSFLPRALTHIGKRIFNCGLI
jgi:hypothetical protein